MEAWASVNFRTAEADQSEVAQANDSIMSSSEARPTKYDSDAIRERRSRILRETRKLIAEKGLDGFNVRLLCQRAGIVARTLYNIFQSKDRVIALAIRETFESTAHSSAYQTPPDTLEGVLDRAIAVNARNLRARNYTQAVVAIYFSQNTPPDLWQVLKGMSAGALDKWLTQLKRRRQLHPWVSIERVEAHIANLEYATIMDWTQGRIDDREYLVRLAESILIPVAGVSRGATHDAVLALLKTMASTGKPPSFGKPTAPDKPPV
jgi:AcrR family transcriptional regulator